MNIEKLNSSKRKIGMTDIEMEDKKSKDIDDLFNNLEIHRNIKYKRVKIDKHTQNNDNKFCVIISSVNSGGAYSKLQNKIMNIMLTANENSNNINQLFYYGYDDVKTILYSMVENTEYEFQFESETIWAINEQMSADKDTSCGISSINYLFLRANKLETIEKFISSTLHKTSGKKIYYFSAENNSWDRVGDLKKRNTSTLILKDGILEDIWTDIDDFTSSEEDYHKYGIPYKKVYLFHGEPGTGKTSLSRVIANYTDRSLYILNFDPKMTDEKLTNAIRYIDSKNAILLLEDIDCLFTSRDNGNHNLSAVSFSSILNNLDGAIQNTGLITIISTNHPELLDAALRRPLRVDKTIKFEKADDHQIRKLFDLYSITNLKNNTIDKIIALASNANMSPAGITGFLFRNRKKELTDNNIIDLFKSYVDEFNVENNGVNTSKMFV